MVALREITFLLDKVTIKNDLTIFFEGRQDNDDPLKDGRYCKVFLENSARKKAKIILKKLFELEYKEKLSFLGLTLKVKGSWNYDFIQYKGRSYKEWTFFAEDIDLIPQKEIPIEMKAFREKVVNLVWEAVELVDCHKSSEGAMSISMGDKIYAWENVFTEDPRVKIKNANKTRKNVKIELFAYVLGPSRHHEWVAENLDNAISKASKDLDKWIEEERNCPPIDSDF